jgi:hypothetical protein
MAAAEVGEEALYARGPALDHREPAVVLAADWAKTKEVMLLKVRCPTTRELLHYVKRIHVVAKTGVVRRVQRDEEWEQTEEGRVFMLMVRLANMGMPCPSCQDIAERCSLRDRDAARYLLSKLQAAKRIRQSLDGKHRIVEIVETGRRTATKAR